jgi:diguanylate cyclase (GGDEF)-like protein
VNNLTPRDRNSNDPRPENWAETGFEHAPVSLWLEDYSALKTLFDQWKAAGVTDLRAHLAADPARITQCTAALRVVAVNRRTLHMFEAPSQQTLIGNLEKILRDDMLHQHVEELLQLWNGDLAFSGMSVNYTLSGRRLNVDLKGVILPGSEEDWGQVLVAIEDVTEREQARHALALQTSYAHALFEHSPVSLWVEDFSAIKTLFDDLRLRGIIDFRVFTDVHPDFVERCMSEIRVLDVNQRTLDLFHAGSTQELLSRLGEIFRDQMHGSFREQLIDLWEGKFFQLREVVNYTLDGETLHLLLQFSVLPGHEHDWSQVQVALTDITARKKAEAYLEYLGMHDVLTTLYNRSFYTDELARLQRRGPHPVTILMMDINGLKTVNDDLGHLAGDALLRRAGEVLINSVTAPCSASRIGGDEFVILMPGMDFCSGERLRGEITKLVALNNQFYSPVALEICFGLAVSEPGEPLEAAIKRADAHLLENKRQYYVEQERNRRRN